MQSYYEEACAASVRLPKPVRRSCCVVWRWNDYGLKRRAEDSFDGALPARLYANHVCKRAHELKTGGRIASREKLLYGWRIVSALFVQLSQRIPTMTHPRIIFPPTCQARV